MVIKEITIGELKKVHELYEKNIYEWRYLLAVYEGLRTILEMSLIQKHEREPEASWLRRKNELVCFEYSKSIVEIFHFFLFKKSADRTLADLNDNPLWNLFLKDADLYKNDFDAVIMDMSKYASIFGHVGILVDKSSKQFASLREQIEEEVYPYIAKYYPQAILDWKWERDENGRPYLSYLKLLDDDGYYRIWTQEDWSIWKVPEDQNVKDDDQAEFIRGGQNLLEEIPFIWHYNYKSIKHGIGKSDIHGISRIDVSLVRNLSQIEEIINYAAFPMMRKPQRDAKPTDINAPQQDDEVSVQSVLEFDPEHPESKPDWLTSESDKSISAILSTIEKKISEIYRAANVGGMAATEPTRNNLSGVAKRIDFNLLNSKIVSKAVNLEDTENRILEYWLKWEGLWATMKDKISIARKRNYDIDDLATMLDNALTAKAMVVSKTFSCLLQKNISRAVLPAATEKDLDIIDQEIEENTKEPFSFEDEENEIFDESNTEDNDREENKKDQDRKLKQPPKNLLEEAIT